MKKLPVQMKIDIGEFARSAKSLARNPLGIVALFLVLVYGFACLVCGISSKALQADERWPLIWFVVVFPFVVLGAFYRLVTKHHLKLYAPSDFHDEKLFFSTVSADAVAFKIREEALVALNAVEDTGTTKGDANRAIESSTVESPPTPEPSTESRRNLEEAADTDTERKGRASKSHNVLQTLQSNIETATRLAISHCEFRYKLNIHRNVATPDGIQFDGIATADGTLHIFEVKYLAEPAYDIDLLAQLVWRVEQMKSRMALGRVVLHLVVVYDFPAERVPGLEKGMNTVVRSNQVTVDISFVSFGILTLSAKLAPADGGSNVESPPSS